MVALKAIANTNGASKFRASLVNNRWIGSKHRIIKGVKTEESFEIIIPKDINNKIRYFFSSIINDYWPTGTPRKHEKLHVDNYVDDGNFCPFNEGLEFKGILVNNKISVDWSYHQKVAKEAYGKYNRESIKNMSKRN